MLETAGFNIPIITDFEPDGTGDLVVGVLSGNYGTDFIHNLIYYKNNGTGAEYDFQLVTTDLLPGLDLIGGSRPVLADLDGDNDHDLVVGTEFNPNNSLSGGQIYYFENTTNDDIPEYVLSDSTFIDDFITTNLAPSFYDLDSDGDLDAIIGEFNGYLLHYTNTDTGWTYNGHYMNLDLSGKTVPAWGDVDQDDDDDLVIGTKDGKVAVYINNGDINTLVLAVQLDIGDDASPAILADGSIVVGNKIGELILLRYDDTDNLVVQDTLEYPYCGQNLAPCPTSSSGLEQEDLLIGSKAGGLQYLEYSNHQRINEMGVSIIPIVFKVKQPRLIPITPDQIQVRIIIKIIKRNAVSTVASWCPDNLNIFKIIRNKFKLWARIGIPLAGVISQPS